MTKFTDPVFRLADLDTVSLERLLTRYGMILEREAAGAPIPGSYWGDEEAGLIGNRLKVRDDTPVHSALHEACHYICMDPDRRAGLDTDAGGDYDEENAVCYLQILLADELTGYDRAKIMKDMDAWGYTFRLGSARAWFEQDAEDARSWLLARGLIDVRESPTFRTRNDRDLSPGSDRFRGREAGDR